MAKTKEELTQLKQEYEALVNKLNELSEDELADVAGGNFLDVLKKIGEGLHSVVKPVVKTVVPGIPTENIGSSDK